MAPSPKEIVDGRTGLKSQQPFSQLFGDFKLADRKASPMGIDKPVLNYRKPPRLGRMSDRVPWGLISIALALSTWGFAMLHVHIGILIKPDAFGYISVAGLIAFFCGLRALPLKAQRLRGVIGCIVALFDLVFLPMLMRS
jgi:hypothetical protein